MTTCSICGQQVGVDELQEHMRIELLDPKWKEQRDNLEARKAQASQLQTGTNVVSSLQNLARTRVDIFGTETDEERRKREEAAERERRKEREKVCVGRTHIEQGEHARQVLDEREYGRADRVDPPQEGARAVRNCLSLVFSI